MDNPMTLDELLSDSSFASSVVSEFEALSMAFDEVYQNIPVEMRMSRHEISFHADTMLLGYLSHLVRALPGAITEIGVWKGKSLALMERFSGKDDPIIGIDPCVLANQREELGCFHERLFPRGHLIFDYSERSVERLQDIAKSIKLLHIDGGHEAYNVWADFLLYERFVVPGGYVVFDDYVDPEFSPEVGPAVDKLEAAGFFSDYEVVSPLSDFASVYVLRKKVDATRATGPRPGSNRFMCWFRK